MEIAELKILQNISSTELEAILANPEGKILVRFKDAALKEVV